MLIQVILTVFEVIFIIAALIIFAKGNSAFLFFIIFAFITIIFKRLISYVADEPNNTPKDIPKVIPNTNNQIKDNIPYYSVKPFLTPYEKEFYQKIAPLNEDYIIIPQVNLASIINKVNAPHRSELFRNIDFGIFTKDFELLLLIELDDKSHNTYSRRDRDLKVKKILDDCHIKLIKFYTYYPNEKNYVLKRIIDNL